MKTKIITGLFVSFLALNLASAMEMRQETTMSPTGAMMIKDDSKMMADTKKDAMMMKKEMTSNSMYTNVSMMSKKEDISNLQMMLVEKGYLMMPKGVSYGYYGNLTKMAYKKYKNGTMMKANATTTGGIVKDSMMMKKDDDMMRSGDAMH